MLRDKAPSDQEFISELGRKHQDNPPDQDPLNGDNPSGNGGNVEVILSSTIHIS